MVDAASASRAATACAPGTPRSASTCSVWEICARWPPAAPGRCLAESPCCARRGRLAGRSEPARRHRPASCHGVLARTVDDLAVTGPRAGLALRFVAGGERDIPRAWLAAAGRTGPRRTGHRRPAPQRCATDARRLTRPTRPTAAGRRRSPIGRPLANTRVYVLDRGLAPVPPGVAGELYMAGAGWRRGYPDRPGLTGGAVRRRPVRPAPAAGCTAPATWCAGARDGDPGVPRPRRRAGEDPRVPDRAGRDRGGAGPRPRRSAQAAVVRARGHARRQAAGRLRGAGGRRRRCPDRRRCARLAGRRLPDYMVPAAFVVLDALPLTPNGKLDRRRLPAPDVARPAPAAAPRTAHEQILCALFAEVLGLDRGRHRRRLLRARRPLAAGDPADQPDPRERWTSRCRSGRCSRRPTVGRAGRACCGRRTPAPRRRCAPSRVRRRCRCRLRSSRLWFLDRLEGPSADLQRSRWRCG